jgi:hypothetical protein
LNSFPHERFWQLAHVYKENVKVYSINATFVTSCNTTKVRDLDVIVPRPSIQINAKRILTTRIYFAFFRGRNDRLNEFAMLIYVYNKCYAIL